MNLKLTRRQFSQLALASTAAAALGTFPNEASAQTPPVILGVRPGSITSTDSTDQTININEQAASTARPIVVESLEIAPTLDTAIGSDVKTPLTTTPILALGEQLSALASLTDGTLIVVATSFTLRNNTDQSTRLIFLGASPKTQTVSGITNQEAFVSLTVLKDGSLVGVVAKRNGTLPIRLVNLNPQTGEITDNRKLPENQRFTNIVGCPDGNLYAIAVGQRGETSLVQLDGGQTTPLSFNDQPWNSGFSNLVCSPSNQLFALGSRRYESPQYLHTIDQNTGVITRLRDFDVAKITIQAS